VLTGWSLVPHRHHPFAHPSSHFHSSFAACVYPLRSCLASDWFAVGVIIFRCLSGRLPFEGLSREAVRSNVMNNTVRWEMLPPHVSRDARALLRELLEPDPTRRLGAAGGVEEVLAHPFFKVRTRACVFVFARSHTVRNKLVRTTLRLPPTLQSWDASTASDHPPFTPNECRLMLREISGTGRSVDGGGSIALSGGLSHGEWRLDAALASQMRARAAETRSCTAMMSFRPEDEEVANAAAAAAATSKVTSSSLERVANDRQAKIAESASLGVSTADTDMVSILAASAQAANRGPLRREAAAAMLRPSLRRGAEGGGFAAATEPPSLPSSWVLSSWATSGAAGDSASASTPARKVRTAPEAVAAAGAACVPSSASALPPMPRAAPSSNSATPLFAAPRNVSIAIEGGKQRGGTRTSAAASRAADAAEEQAWGAAASGSRDAGGITGVGAQRIDFLPTAAVQDRPRRSAPAGPTPMASIEEVDDSAASPPRRRGRRAHTASTDDLDIDGESQSGPALSTPSVVELTGVGSTSIGGSGNSWDDDELAIRAELGQP
jgi:hypothetical protein